MSPTPDRIHLSPPDMTWRERESLLQAFDSNWIAPVGPAIDEFEARLRSITATEDAVALNSGTAALHLGLLALGVGPGDIVVVPTVTFIATANVVRYVGATPHFVDCDPVTGNMDSDSLRQALGDLHQSGNRAKAVITVDLYGACPNYSEIEAICNRYAVPILEDAAESIGASHQGRPAGSFGRLAALSFNGNKLVTTGGGGALVGPRSLLENARHLASQARLPEAHFEHDQVGYAYKMSNLLAAVGVAQLERLDLLVGRTRNIHLRYLEAFHHFPGVEVAAQDAHGGRGNGWLTVLMTDPTRHRPVAEMVRLLQDQQIEARPAWKPMHLQAPYRDFAITGGSNALDHFRCGICLPSGSSMTDGDQQRVINAVIQLLRPRHGDLDLEIDLNHERVRPRPDNPPPIHRVA